MRGQILFGLCWLAGLSNAWADDGLDACLLAGLRAATPETTVQRIRDACSPPALSENRADVAPAAVEVANEPKPALLSDRAREERRSAGLPYAIASHRPNYILLAAFNEQRPDSAPFARDHSTETTKAQKLESKYQISMKAPLLNGVFSEGDALYGAYTQRSFWQVYNRRASAPFRETDYEPEFWYQHPLNHQFLGWTLKGAMLGMNHQSNGRAKDFSRSWNRVFAAIALERGNLAMVLRPWKRITEDSSNDDNRNITHFLGNFDLTMVGKAGGQTWDLMVRNNLHRHGNRGAVQFGWSFPLTERFRGYVQWFKGYGESLIDYDQYQNTVGIGIKLTDW